MTQEHWSVENKLHWVKDMNIGEDDMTIHNHNIVAIVAYLNNMALNAVRMAGYKPTKDTFAKLANKVKQLAKVLNINT